MPHEIVINEQFLETCATGTLMSHALKLGVREFDRLVLVFPQTTLGWRRNHGGPRALVVLEFVIPCLIQDVLSLRAMGVIVDVDCQEEAFR